MPEMSGYEPGMFCWAELATTDRRGATEFYTKLFGWTADESPMGPDPDDVYVMLKKNGLEIGALYREKQMQGMPAHWRNYVATNDADATAAKVEPAGGKLLQPPFDAMDFGRMAVVQDPQGAVLMIWQAKQHFGARLRNEAGAMIWNELTTSDAEGARQFYTSVFPWTAKVSPEYTEWHLGEQAVGGCIEMKGMPVFWMPYFGSDDVDATCQQAKSLGGRVHKEPADIPNVGRFAVLGDPQGAGFAVFKPNM